MLNAICLDQYGNTIHNFTQWDVNQKLIIDIEGYELLNAPQVHFCNKETEKALVVNSSLSANTITASIPNELLRLPYMIYAYIYMTEGSGKRTIAVVRIPVRERKQPNDYTYSDDDNVIYLEDKIEEINSIIDTINAMDIDNKVSSMETILYEFDNKIATLSEIQSYIG